MMYKIEFNDEMTIEGVIENFKNLNDAEIYKTDKDGSIMFKIKNNKLKIEILCIIEKEYDKMHEV